MKQLLILFLFFATQIDVNAQGDLLVLKKRNQTMQTWIQGSYITFQFSSRQWIQGMISQIRNDSVTIDQIDIRTVPNQFGFPTIDTARLGLLKLHVNEIYGMPKRSYGGDIFTDGSLLQLGSGAFVFVNLINSFIKGYSFFGSDNLPRLGIAGGVFLIGSVLHTWHRSFLTMGNTYTMQTIHTAASK